MVNKSGVELEREKIRVNIGVGFHHSKNCVNQTDKKQTIFCWKGNFSISSLTVDSAMLLRKNSDWSFCALSFIVALHIGYLDLEIIAGGERESSVTVFMLKASLFFRYGIAACNLDSWLFHQCSTGND